MKIEEYIKREDALSLKKPFPNQKGMITLYRQYFIDPEAVEQLPAADVVEVVRCKDCKYAHLTYDSSCKYCDMWESGDPLYLPSEFYCANGERRETQDG